MALFSLSARSQLLPMAATFFVGVGVVLIASSGLAEGQSIHVSLRITKPDDAVLLVPSSVPVDHEFGQYPGYRSSRIERTYIGESRWDDEYPRWAVPRVQVIDLRLTVKLLQQIASDPSAADAWVERNMISRRHRCSPHQPHHHHRHHQYHKISMPSTTTTTSTQRIDPFGNQNHVLIMIRSAMQNIFESLGASPAGLQDEDQVIRLSRAGDHIHRGNSFNYILDAPPVEGCSCRRPHHIHHQRRPLASTVGPQEISIPTIDHIAPSDAFIRRPHHQARYRTHFDTYDHQNSGSSSMWFGDGRAGGEGVTKPTAIKGQEKSGYKGTLELI
ncbi:hypothetical protein H6P81_016335 [Aristolochia fimbriata]|uniref:Uncharacterized protein n=1 Tax=Aristolochia fimbriata TaxID=158543 RepID=A0AAV7E7Z3_ARIFI|nr:hypothetical protein H6P81_016335 [Aristolochia fimbriata]